MSSQSKIKIVEGSNLLFVVRVKGEGESEGKERERRGEGKGEYCRLFRVLTKCTG